MAGLLDANGGPSSIRFSLILTSIGIFILLLAAALYVVVAAFSPEMGTTFVGSDRNICCWYRNCSNWYWIYQSTAKESRNEWQ